MVTLNAFVDSSVIQVSETKDWHAWINLMPPPPNDFIVIGKVKVPNPGVSAVLTSRIPQGINPTILLLELTLIQNAGNHIQLMTYVEARYSETVSGNSYRMVQIFSDNTAIAEIPVEETR